MLYLRKPRKEVKPVQIKAKWIPLLEVFKNMEEQTMEVCGWDETCEGDYVARASAEKAIKATGYKMKSYVKHRRLYIEKEG